MVKLGLLKMRFRTKKVECRILEDKRQYGHATAKKMASKKVLNV